MTNPFDPNADKNSANNGFGNGENDNAANSGDLPRYEPTSHPEDQAGFGQSGNYGSPGSYGSDSSSSDSYGASSYGTGQEYGGYGDYGAYNAGSAGYAGAGYNSSDAYAGPGPEAGPAYTGPVSAMEAIKWGFGAALKNPLLWLVGAFVVALIQILPQFGISVAANGGDNAGVSVAANFLSLLTTVFGIVVGLVVYRLAYREIDTPKPTWGTVFQGVRWVPPLVVSLVLGVIATVVVGIAIFALVFLGIGGAAATNAENFEELGDGQILAIVGSVLGGVLVFALISLFIQPFFTLMPWLAADTSSIGEAFSQGLKLGKENYSHILLLIVLSGLLYAASIITLGLALIVIAPAMQLATAHLCRQCQGRYAPAA